MGEKESNLFVKEIRDTFEYVFYLVFASQFTFFYLSYSYCNYLCILEVISLHILYQYRKKDKVTHDQSNNDLHFILYVNM
jgi:hypothetical protein